MMNTRKTVVISCINCNKWTTTWVDVNSNSVFPGPDDLKCEHCGSSRLNYRSTESIETWLLKKRK
jgi:hypothetical protein